MRPCKWSWSGARECLLFAVAIAYVAGIVAGIMFLVGRFCVDNALHLARILQVQGGLLCPY